MLCAYLCGKITIAGSFLYSSSIAVCADGNGFQSGLNWETCEFSQGNEIVNLMTDDHEGNTREREVDVEELTAKLERLSLDPASFPSLVVSELATDIELNLRSRRRMDFRIGRGRGRGERARPVANAEIMEIIEEL